MFSLITVYLLSASTALNMERVILWVQGPRPIALGLLDSIVSSSIMMSRWVWQSLSLQDQIKQFDLLES